MITRQVFLWVGFVVAVVLTLLPAVLLDGARAEDATPTPEEYVGHVGGDSQLLQPGEFELDGRRQSCGQRPVVIDNKLDDYGAAYPGFLIMNPRLLDKVSTPVKQWIFAHECGHQFRGPDEETADCFAVQRGRRQGWLLPEGLEEVCNFIRPKATACISPAAIAASTCASATPTRRSDEPLEPFDLISYPRPAQRA